MVRFDEPTGYRKLSWVQMMGLERNTRAHRSRGSTSLTTRDGDVESSPAAYKMKGKNKAALEHSHGGATKKRRIQGPFQVRKGRMVSKMLSPLTLYSIMVNTSVWNECVYRCGMVVV